jgi:predicted house-cleaning noncanonical NTP pyrophosphatase (MazG superfamily)
MDLKDILDALREYGFSGTIIGFVILCLWLIAKSTWFSNVMSKISDGIFDKFSKKSTESSIKVINELDVLNHDIFNYIDFWMYSRVPTFQFSTDYRTAVFRKYLTIFLKKHKENIRKYVDNKNFEKMEDSELWTSLLSLINDIIYDYEKEMELAGIPKVIIEKMKVKNNDTISLTIDLIEGICNSQFYSSDKNLLKIYSILNIMLSILENTISNSDHICNSINGQLKGMSMDGKTEP